MASEETSGHDFDLYWLRHNPIQQEPHNRVAVPSKTFLFNYLREDRVAHWGYRDNEPRWSILTRNEDKLKDDDDYHDTQDVKVRPNKTVTVPAKQLNSWEKPADIPDTHAEEMRPHKETWVDYGETLHFFVDRNDTESGFVYVLKDIDGRDVLENQGFSTDRLTDGGRDRTSMVKQVLTGEERGMPEAFVGEEEVLHVATGEIYHYTDVFEELRSRYEPPDE